MQQILAKNDTEILTMCFGAAFVEENQVLEELLQGIDVDSLGDSERREEEVRLALQEVGQFFFSLNMNFDETIQEEAMEILDIQWGVRDRTSALSTLEEIRKQGHRTKFNVLKNVVSSSAKIDFNCIEKFRQIFEFDFKNNEDLKMTDEDYAKLAEWIQSTQNFLGSSGILAWDLGRYVHLVRLSFMANLINDEEAWDLLAKLTPLAQDSFSSWMDFSKSFLIGRTFWAGAADPVVKQACERLMGYPISPWILIPWP